MITGRYRDRVVEWEPVSSRIIKVNLEMEEKISLIQVYAPTQDAEQFEKDLFYTQLQDTIDKVRDQTRHIVIMGDWNSRIGRNVERGHGSMRLHGGEKAINTNGERMIDFCIANDLLIGNTFFSP